jgi:hypothetical protein
MAQNWSIHALVYFYSAGSDLPWAVLYWRLDLEFADMKVIKDHTRKDGVRKVTVQLDDGEYLVGLKADSYYRLGGQLDDVVGTHCIAEGNRVVWCSIEQKWVEA